MLAVVGRCASLRPASPGVVASRPQLPVLVPRVSTTRLPARLPTRRPNRNMHNPLLMHAGLADEHTRADIAAAKLTPRGNSLPPVVHARAAAAGRIVCIGDIHGCLHEVRDLLSKCKFQQEHDTLVLVGDLVNKGPHSAGVVAEARRLGALSVRGNHDDACLAAYVDHKAGRPVKVSWKTMPVAASPEPQTDKHDWVIGLTAEDAGWLSTLPFTLCLRDTLLVVHAGLVPGVPRREQKLQDLYTMRDVIPRSGGGWEACEQHTRTGHPWAQVWDGPRHVLFGHDAQRRLQLRHSATGLDTGCVYGGELTAAVLPPAHSNSFLSKVKLLLGRCLPQRKSSGGALTLQQLGGHIVSVPSRQPRKK